MAKRKAVEVCTLDCVVQYIRHAGYRLNWGAQFTQVMEEMCKLLYLSAKWDDKPKRRARGKKA